MPQKSKRSQAERAREPSPPNIRRALTHVGGKLELDGPDERALAATRSALAVSADDRISNAHVHGFHSYPARLHPVTARRLIEHLSAPGQCVVDPFCGSGTVLVEARLGGRRAVGLDANPLGVELAWLKTLRTSVEDRRALCAAAERVARSAEQRRIAKAGPKQRYPPEDLELFEIHVLLELDGLKAAIAELEAPFSRRALNLVLSALLTKFSRRAGDASTRTKNGRFASGLVIRFFLNKAEELARRLGTFGARLPEQAPEPELFVGDARDLRPLPAACADLIVTSPPYPGVYDYYEQHALRLRWLELDGRSLQASELGSRREFARITPAMALERWQTDFGRCLSAMRRVLKQGAPAAMLIADSVAGGRALYMQDALLPLLARHGFSVLAHGAQIRPHFHRRTEHAFRARPRREHLFVVGTRPGAPVSASGGPRRRP
jgi:DNA modification methylase